MNRSILSIRIENLRNELKLTQIELANKLGLNSSASISQYESSDRVPSDEVKLKMCAIFNCSMDYLLGISNFRNSEPRVALSRAVDNDKELTDEQKKNINAFIDMLKKQNKKD